MQARHKVWIALTCTIILVILLIFWLDSSCYNRFQVLTFRAPAVVRSVKLLKGWSNYAGAHIPAPLVCDSYYTCDILTTGGNNPGAADLVVFHPMGMPETPPIKPANQLWLMRTGESQGKLTVERMENWDGLFNYSFTFVRDSNLSEYYSFSYRKLKKTLTRNFAEEMRTRNIGSLESASILWFVSNCHGSGEYKVTSARLEYASELSRWISLSAYTKTDHCKSMFEKIHPGLLKAKPATGEPSLDDFPFYLAFENSLCKDYITEKFWKILGGDSLAIPIVMGGLEMEDYKLVAPPNSYIHVRNFTSPRELAKHLKYVMENEEAFNYYHQWRNEYELFTHARPEHLCHYCILAHERPASVWHKMSEHFNRKHCVDVSEPRHYCRYYNLTCPDT